ncbi:low affinity sulfate transporter 3 isoform X1 [Arachis duranensis]|uniref:Low affinity sulfate transporter 3 isoform X1 n=2 Tax=Arachis duranensis TaxID=130453 RepID=A0A9C6U111_ARADU|nr:low affinity sulfate transporter 3 isoform X1 [Arachis duranensis]
MDEEEQDKGDYQTKIQFLIVEMSRVTDIDTSVIHALEELHRSLEKRDVEGPRVKLKNVSWAITTLALKRTAVGSWEKSFHLSLSLIFRVLERQRIWLQNSLHCNN